jgi:hypothetical protein
VVVVVVVVCSFDAHLSLLEHVLEKFDFFSSEKMAFASEK